MKKVIATITAASTLFLASCGLGTAGGLIPSGELQGELSDIDLQGASIGVGSKNFTEQIVLGKIAAILLESAGANARDLTNVPGSTSARQALVTGDLDMMFEYTGTAWITYMGNTDPIPDEQEQYEAVKAADKENGIEWLPPFPMNNTYAIASNAETGEEYDLSTLHDIANVPVEEQTICTDAEFRARNDGLYPMLEAYGLEAPPQDNIMEMDSGAVYAAVSNGDCNLGVVFATDGRIPALDLNVLEDPEAFFPKYNAALTVRSEVLEEYPEIEELFAPLRDLLTNEKMQELNARVDIEGQDYADVAYDFLVEEGFLAE
ncbi:glycine betaine ABC transporter substrate-binding protein [Corynebacterium sp. L4756]|uniref:glycine betaine ABC transporter substrate-binding protein n=1 Tax=unclassified Corynebacterium TaxID=2624378 RepID=UPI00374D69A7